MATQSARRAATRQRILDAASELFLAEGLSVTVEAIVARADVAKGTFFYHFPTRDGLMRALGRAAMAQTAQRILARPGARRDPLRTLRAFLVECSREGQQQPELTRAYLVASLRSGAAEAEDARIDPLPAGAVRGAKAPRVVSRATPAELQQSGGRMLIIEMIAEAQKLGQLRDDVPAWELAAMLGFMVLAADLVWVRDPSPGGLVNRVERALDVFQHGAGKGELRRG